MLNDVTVLSNGDIRIVWAAAPVGGTDHDIWAMTFTPPGASSGGFDGHTQSHP